MVNSKEIKHALSLIFEGMTYLNEKFPERKFTIDGRLVGDIGEVLASRIYDISLDKVSEPKYDATVADGRRVQIKVTFQDALTLKTNDGYYIGLKLFTDGRYEEIYNGPAKNIYERYSHRKGIGEKLLRFPNKNLKKMGVEVAENERIPKRDS